MLTFLTIQNNGLYLKRSLALTNVLISKMGVGNIWETSYRPGPEMCPGLPQQVHYVANSLPLPRSTPRHCFIYGLTIPGDKIIPAHTLHFISGSQASCSQADPLILVKQSL